ncbi:pectate lyase [Pseudomonas sp. FP1742]|uniref:pectate lyase n=1 Tax=Pseudomonas sp. FP1742 TaxID=2954079 RepID=UPI0027374C4E|nr:pectate lyase [Pseudomonas sp. FP1742]WLG48103.1 pectate lyase [Pseudomonas sp. FP1742]
MADLNIIINLGQGASGANGVGAQGDTGLGQTGANGGQSGASALEDLAGLLAEMLLNSSSGQQGTGTMGSGDGSSAISDLLEKLKSGNSDVQGSGQGGTSDRGATQGGDEAADKELLKQVLLALFEKVLGGDNAEGSNQSKGSDASGGAGAGGNQLNSLGGTNELGGGSGVGGTSGSGDSQSIEDLLNNLMKSLSDSSLKNSVSPTADGGGQVSQDGNLKELLELISQFMDSHPETFGDAAKSGNTSSGQGTSLVSAGGSPSPVSGGGGGSGAAPEVGGSEGAALTVSGTAGDGGGALAPAGTDATGLAPSSSATSSTGGASNIDFPSASSNPTVVNETIKVGPGETFDGGGKTFTAGSALGDGGQSEGQKPLFELAEGATLKNVVIGENGADGVHVKAASEKAVNVDNVHWTNVGEDALTVKDGGAKTTNLNVTNSTAQGANDKVFQLNADANVNVDNFKVKDFGTFMRTNGGQQGNWNLDLNNISAENGKYSFVKSDSEGLNLKTHNIDLQGVENAYTKLPQSTKREDV